MNNDQKNCITDIPEQGYFIPMRRLGLIGALIVVMMTLSFLIGYLWGKKSSLENFCKITERESLADHIFVALCGVSDYKEAVEAPASTDMDEVIDEQETVVQQAPPLAEQEVVQSSDVQTEVDAQQQLPPMAEQPQEYEDQTKASHESYYAELIGFGTMQGAKRFADRLEKKQTPVSINKRVSKTAKGRTVTWYQVVTTAYSNKDELIALVNTIKNQERLNDVRIVSNV